MALCLAGPAGAALDDELKEANRLHHAGQSAAALQRIDAWLAQRPREAQLRFLKSVILADTGRRAEAGAILQQLAQDYPELAEPHNNLAALHAAGGEWARARGELEETLRRSPGYAPALENLGDVYVMLAGESYARALRAEPTNPTVPRKLALVRQLSGPMATSASAAFAASAAAGGGR